MVGRRRRWSSPSIYGRPAQKVELTALARVAISNGVVAASLQQTPPSEGCKVKLSFGLHPQFVTLSLERPPTDSAAAE